MVTAVAVINYILGGVAIFFGFASTIFGGLAGAAFGEALSGSIRGRIAGTLGGIVVGLIIACTGVPNIFAGYGVYHRKEWGRILALVLAGLAGFSALGSAVGESLGYWISGAHFIFVFVVLLEPRYKREFGELRVPSEPSTSFPKTRRRLVADASPTKQLGNLLVLCAMLIGFLIILAVLVIALSSGGDAQPARWS